MLTIPGPRQRFCDGISRRSFLKIGAFGAGLKLTDMIRLRASAPDAGPTALKSAIMIYLPGGPSHLDMYDLKPDAPAEFRGHFKPIATNVPGVQIGELMPLQARIMDKLALIRSIVSVDEHSDALVMTGYSHAENRTAHHPSFGAVISRLRGSAHLDLPSFVNLRGRLAVAAQNSGLEPGYLGVAHCPFAPNGAGMADLRLPAGVDASRLCDRRTLLASFNSLRRDLDTTGSMKGLDAFSRRAFDMVLSGTVYKALDLTREPARVRDRYQGVEQCLLARRLVEAGVGCVTLTISEWDTHGSSHFPRLREQVPLVDRGVANLVQDLHDRGLDQDVVILMWGEFGRTPKINRDAGRDHWAPVMSAVVAGGGLKMGQVVGSSSARGEHPKNRPCTVSQILSTIYRVVGINPARTFVDSNGRPRPILDDRVPLTELL